MLCKLMLMFNEVIDFLCLDLNSKSVVELILGIMGFGKIYYVI